MDGRSLLYMIDRGFLSHFLSLTGELSLSCKRDGELFVRLCFVSSS